MAAARCVDHNELAALIGQVEEGMRNLGWQIGKAPLVDVMDRVADADLEATFQHVDGFFLKMMHMQGRPAMRGHFNNKIVKGAILIFTRDFENQVPAWPRLKPQTFACTQNDLLAGTNCHG